MRIAHASIGRLLVLALVLTIAGAEATTTLTTTTVTTVTSTSFTSTSRTTTSHTLTSRSATSATSTGTSFTVSTLSSTATTVTATTGTSTDTSSTLTSTSVSTTSVSTTSVTSLTSVTTSVSSTTTPHSTTATTTSSTTSATTVSTTTVHTTTLTTDTQTSSTVVSSTFTTTTRSTTTMSTITSATTTTTRVATLSVELAVQGVDYGLLTASPELLSNFKAAVVVTFRELFGVPEEALVAGVSSGSVIVDFEVEGLGLREAARVAGLVSDFVAEQTSTNTDRQDLFAAAIAAVRDIRAALPSGDTADLSTTTRPASVAVEGVRQCQVEAPTNGDLGECSLFLDIGRSCTAGCNEGYTLSGSMECRVGGVLRPAECSALAQDKHADEEDFNTMVEVAAAAASALAAGAVVLVATARLSARPVATFPKSEWDREDLVNDEGEAGCCDTEPRHIPVPGVYATLGDPSQACWTIRANGVFYLGMLLRRDPQSIVVSSHGFTQVKSFADPQSDHGVTLLRVKGERRWVGAGGMEVSQLSGTCVEVSGLLGLQAEKVLLVRRPGALMEVKTLSPLYPLGVASATASFAFSSWTLGVPTLAVVCVGLVAIGAVCLDERLGGLVEGARRQLPADGCGFSGLLASLMVAAAAVVDGVAGEGGPWAVALGVAAFAMLVVEFLGLDLLSACGRLIAGAACCTASLVAIAGGDDSAEVYFLLAAVVFSKGLQAWTENEEAKVARRRSGAVKSEAASSETPAAKAVNPAKIVTEGGGEGAEAVMVAAQQPSQGALVVRLQASLRGLVEPTLHLAASSSAAVAQGNAPQAMFAMSQRLLEQAEVLTAISSSQEQNDVRLALGAIGSLASFLRETMVVFKAGAIEAMQLAATLEVAVAEAKENLPPSASAVLHGAAAWVDAQISSITRKAMTLRSLLAEEGSTTPMAALREPRARAAGGSIERDIEKAQHVIYELISLLAEMCAAQQSADLSAREGQSATAVGLEELQQELVVSSQSLRLCAEALEPIAAASTTQEMLRIVDTFLGGLQIGSVSEKVHRMLSKARDLTSQESLRRMTANLCGPLPDSTGHKVQSAVRPYHAWAVHTVELAAVAHKSIRDLAAGDLAEVAEVVEGVIEKLLDVLPRLAASFQDASEMPTTESLSQILLQELTSLVEDYLVVGAEYLNGVYTTSLAGIITGFVEPGLERAISDLLGLDALGLQLSRSGPPSTQLTQRSTVSGSGTQRSYRIPDIPQTLRDAADASSIYSSEARRAVAAWDSQVSQPPTAAFDAPPLPGENPDSALADAALQQTSVTRVAPADVSLTADELLVLEDVLEGGPTLTNSAVESQELESLPLTHSDIRRPEEAKACASAAIGGAQASQPPRLNLSQALGAAEASGSCEPHDAQSTSDGDWESDDSIDLSLDVLSIPEPKPMKAAKVAPEPETTLEAALKDTQGLALCAAKLSATAHALERFSAGWVPQDLESRRRRERPAVERPAMLRPVSRGAQALGRGSRRAGTQQRQGEGGL